MAQRRLDRASPVRSIEAARQRVDETVEALTLRASHVLALRAASLRSSALRLHTLSPLLTIARGYAIVRREADGALVTSVTQVTPGDGSERPSHRWTHRRDRRAAPA